MILLKSTWCFRVLLLLVWLQSSHAWCDDVEKLIAELKAPTSEVREAAAKSLGKLKDARAAAPLVYALSHNETSVEEAAYEALVSLDVLSVAPLAEALKAGDFSAARVLIKIGKPSVAPVVNILVNSDFMGNPGAAYTLSSIGAPAVDPLIAALKDITRRKIVEPQEEGHIWKVAGVLTRIGTPVVQPLIATLNDDNSRMREASAIVLGRVKDPRAIAPLIAAFKDRDHRVKSAALDALGYIGAPAVGPLISTLKDSDPDIREQARAALDRIGIPSVEPLITALTDQNATLRAAAIRCLANNKDQRVADLRVLALKDKDKEVRQDAALALGLHQDPRAIEALIAIMHESPDNKLRMSALYELYQFKDARIIPSFIKLLADSNSTKDLRYVAEQALFHFGEQTIEPLSAALKDPDPAIHEVAAKMLEAIKHQANRNKSATVQSVPSR